MKRSALLIGIGVAASIGVGTILWCVTGSYRESDPETTLQGEVPLSAVSDEAPPPTPEEFRVLRTVPISEAVPLVKLLQQSNAAIEIRLELAEIYRSRGYYGAAAFFRNTARLAQGQALDLSPVESPIAWSANVDSLSERPSRVAKQVSELIASGRYSAAIERAQKDIEEHGASLRVVAEWADAVLWETIEDREVVSDQALEVALRILLTTVEEQVYRPHGFISRAGGYKRVSDAFLYLDDPTSAETAAVLALATAKPGSVTGGLADFTRRQLCERIAKLERQTRLSAEPSRSELCGH